MSRNKIGHASGEAFVVKEAPPPTAVELWREERTEQFRRAAIRFREMSIEVDELALILNDTAGECECCGAVTFRYWHQRQLRARVAGSAERMREIADTLDQKSRNPDFIGEPMPALRPDVLAPKEDQ